MLYYLTAAKLGVMQTLFDDADRASLVARGPAAAGEAPHAFFGKLSGDEWGQLMYKHIDHHLRQFGG